MYVIPLDIQYLILLHSKCEDWFNMLKSKVFTLDALVYVYKDLKIYPSVYEILSMYNLSMIVHYISKPGIGWQDITILMNGLKNYPHIKVVERLLCNIPCYSLYKKYKDCIDYIPEKYRKYDFKITNILWNTRMYPNFDYIHKIVKKYGLSKAKRLCIDSSRNSLLWYLTKK